MICRSGGRVVWRISPIICLRIRGRWGDEKRSLPHSHSVREAGRRSREEVCACVREIEREKVNTWGRGNLHSGKGFVWVTIAIRSGAGIVIDWDNWVGINAVLCLSDPSERIVSSQRR